MPDKFNSFRVEALLEAASRGFPHTMIAGAGGISTGTLYNWLNKGREEFEALGDHEEPEPFSFAAFYEAFQRAMLQTDALAIGRMKSEMEKEDGAWQAAAWWLERRHPDAFGKRSETRITGHDGGPVRITAIEVVREVVREDDNVVDVEPRLLEDRDG